MSDHNGELAAQSGAYALNALTPDERATFEEHLASSDETRTETTELSDTAVALGLAVEPIMPPPELKENLMAMIAKTPQLPRQADAPAASNPSATANVTPPVAPVIAALVPVVDDDSRAQRDQPSASPAEAKAQARWFARPATALVAVAAAVAIIVTGGVVASSIGRTAAPDSTFASEQADRLAAINAASDSQRLVSTVAGGATATFVWSGELASSAVIVDGLEPLPADQVYELWYINDSGARPAGLMSAATNGPTWRVLDGEMSAGDLVGVTIEPKGGSDTPTSDPIVVFESA